MDNQPDFYQAAKDWQYDLYHSNVLWLRRCLVLIIVLLMLLALSLAANVLLFPLKEKVPYLYAFDKATGEVTPLGQLAPTQFSHNWIMTQYFLTHYVVNRESYDADNLEAPYQIAIAMSADDVQTSYAAEVSDDNPNSPQKRYGKNQYVTVQVLSISRLNEDTALVHFHKMLHDRSSGAQTVSAKEVIIRWQYTNPVTTEKALIRDPLGFKVIDYQVSNVGLTS